MYVSNVFFSIFVINQNVIDIDYIKVVEIFVQNVINIILKKK